MQQKVSKSWQPILQPEFEKEYFKELTAFVTSEYKEYQCFPKEDDIFAAFNFCSFDALKVVIIGQDPYHDEGQANGLCFSVKDDVKHLYLCHQNTYLGVCGCVRVGLVR